MKKRCVVLKAEKMQSACFFSTLLLVSIEQKRALRERDTNTRHPFLSMVLRVLLCSHVPSQEKKNWIVLRAKHQRQGFYYYL